jgi:hypothetical protein
MYTFAIVALLALGTIKLVDFLADNIAMADRMRSLLTFVVGVGIVLALDFSLFDGFRADISDRNLGVWATGFVVAGMTVPWRALFAYLTSHKAMSDETLGHHAPIRRVA